MRRQRFWYATATCPCCRAGELGFVLASDHQTLLLACYECSACYLDKASVVAEQAIFPEPPDFGIDQLGCSISFPEARWATRAEIEERGWASSIGGYYD